MDPIIYYVAFILSVALSGLLAVSLVTYVLRTWQLIRSERDGSLASETLDKLDQIETRLTMLMDKVDGNDRDPLVPPCPSDGLASLDAIASPDTQKLLVGDSDPGERTPQDQL